MPHALDALLLLERSTVKPRAAATLHAVLRLEALGRPDKKRPPLDLVACLDVSGSMAGEKLDAVKRSLHALSAELSSADRLGVVGFEARVHQVLPPTVMDNEGKARLRAAVSGLTDRGNTFMSGGLLAALESLSSSAPLSGEAVRRVLLFTDGHANAGIAEDDRPGWTELLKRHLGALSVSWFGFGEDHDAEFLAWLSDLSRGNAYVAKDADAISDGFAQELGGLLGVRATDIELTVTPSAGALSLLNDERVEKKGAGLVIQLADLSCEERKDLVLAWQLPAEAAHGKPSLSVRARFRDALTGDRQELLLSSSVATTARRLGTPNREVREAVELVRAASAQGLARTLAEQHRYDEAAALIRSAASALAGVGSDRARALSGHLLSLADDYGNPHRYGTSKSKLMASHRAMSKQRSSGSDADAVFLTESKRAMQERFRQQAGAANEDPAQVDPRLVEQLEREMVDHFRRALLRSRVRAPGTRH